MVTEPQIRELLRNVYDPDFKLNLVELGAVYRVAIEPDLEAPGAGIPGVPPRHRVAVELLETSADEISKAQLGAVVRNLLAGTPEIAHASVLFVAEPAWTPGRISSEGVQRLQQRRPAKSSDFPILNDRMG